MKKKVIVSVILAACFSFSGIFSGCDIFDKPTEPPMQTVYTLSTEDIALLLGAEYRPDFVLKQNGEIIDATITFSSSATEYVSVSNGKLKAEKLGEATITAIATLENKEVARATFKCKVNENKGIHPVKNSYLLYISETVKGVSFENSSTLDAFVYENGEVKSDVQLKWRVDDETVAMIDENNRLKAVGLGETCVVGEYVNASGESLKTMPLPVKVETPVLISDEDVIVDKQSEFQVFDAQQILGAESISSVENLSVGKSYEISANQIKTNLFGAGEYTCVFYDSKKTIGVQVNLVAADFVIYDNDDLLQVPTFTGGYIALANDLTDVDYVDSHQESFSGIFNGLGHSISNIRFKNAWGLFYRVNGATIKNVAIVNASLEQASGGAFFYQAWGGENVVDNTYVSIDCSPTIWQAGGICGFVFRGKLIYSNSIVYANGFDLTSNGKILGRNNTQILIQNAFALGSGLLCGTANRDNANFETVNRSAGVSYLDEAALIVDIDKRQVDFSGFNKYWDLSQDIPRM